MNTMIGLSDRRMKCDNRMIWNVKLSDRTKLFWNYTAQENNWWDERMGTQDVLRIHIHCKGWRIGSVELLWGKLRAFCSVIVVNSINRWRRLVWRNWASCNHYSGTRGTSAYKTPRSWDKRKRESERGMGRFVRSVIIKSTAFRLVSTNATSALSLSS